MRNFFRTWLVAALLALFGTTAYAVTTQDKQKNDLMPKAVGNGANTMVLIAPEFTVHRDRTAVLVMDYQNDIVNMLPPDVQASLLDRASIILKAARQARLPVVYIVIRFRDGYPEINARNKQFSDLKDSRRLREGTSGAEINARVAPQPGDIVVTKRRVGAFSTTELETVLRAHNINTLVLLGIATSGVVLSTVRWAADMDYSLIVVSDACADRDAEVNSVLMDRVFPRQATVVTTREFVTAIGVKDPE
jgi:nicotinamidase-related amidase